MSFTKLEERFGADTIQDLREEFSKRVQQESRQEADFLVQEKIEALEEDVQTFKEQLEREYAFRTAILENKLKDKEEQLKTDAMIDSVIETQKYKHRFLKLQEHKAEINECLIESLSAFFFDKQREQKINALDIVQELKEENINLKKQLNEREGQRYTQGMTILQKQKFDDLVSERDMENLTSEKRNAKLSFLAELAMYERKQEQQDTLVTENVTDYTHLL